MSSANPLIVNTDHGLYCPQGDFHIDAWQPVSRNIVTHAHSDHARHGSEKYLTASDGVFVLKKRLGQDIRVDPLNYNTPLTLGSVSVSLHPAGHVLGSSQIRIEHKGEVWVFTGDYKTQSDPTCRPFELVRCHTFITECTFGLPLFHWPEPQRVLSDINNWWRNNIANGRTSILLAYALGKAQRVLAGLDSSIGPILLHGAVHSIVQSYRDSGVQFPASEYASADNARLHRGKAIVIAPPSALNSIWARKFNPISDGIASGWMQIRGFRRRRAADRGFVFSDHVDWQSLQETICATGAQKVIATHGYTGALVKFLQEKGFEAEAFETRFKAESDEEDLPPPDAPVEAAET